MKRLLACTVFLLTSCITTEKEKEMRGDIHNLQTRLLQVEQQQGEKTQALKSSGESTAQRVASTSVELERIQREIQKIRGEIDAVKVGVMTGQMPGQESNQEGSIAATMTGLSARVAALEAGQKDIMDAIQKAATAKPVAAKEKKADKKEKADKSATPMQSFKDLQSAFEKKRFKQIVENGGDSVSKGVSGKEKEDAVYMYAESLFKLGKLKDSALKFNELIELKSATGKYGAHARMRLGDAFRHLNDAATAKIYYEELVSKFPGTPEADKAKERLVELGSKAKG